MSRVNEANLDQIELDQILAESDRLLEQINSELVILAAHIVKKLETKP
jgi:hypothetical protein